MVLFFVNKFRCLEMDHFHMFSFRKHFIFFLQQQRIIGESSLVKQSYPRRNNTKKCF